MDSEFGLVFYSYLSIGTLNLKFRRRPCRGFLLHSRPTFALRRKGRLSVFGALLTPACRPLLLRRKGRLSVLMICFRWVRANPLLLRRKVWLNPAYVEHQQQQACNTIRGGYWFCTTGLRPVTPRLVVETASAVLRGFRVWFSVL